MQMTMRCKQLTMIQRFVLEKLQPVSNELILVHYCFSAENDVSWAFSLGFLLMEHFCVS